MQDNLILMGINAPKPHQATITRLIHGLADLYLKDKTHLFPYPETMIDEGQTSPAPDILLYDHQLEKTIVIIEITHTAGVKKDTNKVVNLLQDYDVQEGFIYDYKKDIWYKTEGHEVTQDVSSSFCKALQIDLAKLLRDRL
jgi:Uma2 family endonuclease